MKKFTNGEGPLATLTIIYDNRTMNPSLKGGFGFSCIIEFGDKKVLFDTGGNEEAFLRT